MTVELTTLDIVRAATDLGMTGVPVITYEPTTGRVSFANDAVMLTAVANVVERGERQ